MITRTVPDWQAEFAQAIRDPGELLQLLELTPDELPLPGGDTGFPLNVPHPFIRRMARCDPADPLLRQVAPLEAERFDAPGFTADPVGELNVLRSPGVLHKYHGRALLTLTGACGVHCRYCFRRHFPYTHAGGGEREWHSALEYIGADKTIREVILSGGDPLTIGDERLAPLAKHLARIPHLKRLRIHTRLPVVIPSRVNGLLLNWLGNSRLKTVMVLQINHANELDRELSGALNLLADAGITLLNQAVLLRGVNDDEGRLHELSETLFHAGVMPYYLHQLDRVAGAAHFAVADSRAIELHRGLQTSLPGYMVPRLVRELPGNPFKQLLANEPQQA